MPETEKSRELPLKTLTGVEQDSYFMRLALRLAKKALGNTSPNPLVGALLVSQGQVIGQGYHQKAGEPHAEVLALRDYYSRKQTTKGKATLYVTLEPCCHYGRTPPCMNAIIEAGFIERVIVAMEDPNPLVAGKGIAGLRQAGIEVVTGICEQEARQLNEIFIKYITAGLPFITIKAAVTLDGKIATANGDSQWITGEQARAYVHKLRASYDAVMVGIGTALKDNPRLTSRPAPGNPTSKLKKKQHWRIVVDSKGRIPLDALVLDEQEKAKTILAVTAAAPQDKLASIQARGCEVLVCNQTPDGRVDVRDLCRQLAKKGITSVLVEGGGELNASLLKERLVDKFMVFIAPKLIGGAAAPGFLMGEGVSWLKDAYTLHAARVKKWGEDFLIEAYVCGPDHAARSLDSEALLAGERPQRSKVN